MGPISRKFVFNQHLKNVARRFLFPFIGGLIFSLAFPNDLSESVPPLFFCSMLGMAFFYSETRFSNDRILPKIYDMLAPLGFTCGIYVFGINWIAQSLQDFTSMPRFLVIILSVIFSCFLVLQFWLFPLLMHCWHWLKNKFSSNISFNLILNRAIPYRLPIMAFVIVWVENNITTYFPIHAGITWAHLAPNLGLAPIVGAMGFSFISNLVGLALAQWIVNDFKRQHWRWDIISFLILFLILNFSFRNTWRSDTQDRQKTNIRLVQGNIDRVTKRDAEFELCNDARAEVYEVYRQLTLKPTTLPKIDLIAWPESAYPSTLQSHLMLNEGFPVTEFLEEMLRETKTEMLIGAVDFTNRSPQSTEMAQHNASFLFDKNKKLKNVYHKNKLMPIGEILPFDFMYTYLQKLSQNISRMNPGTTPTLFTLDNGVNFITVICFEVLFSGLIRQQIGMLKKDVHFIVNMSNDSWFSESIMPVQNLFFSKWVALENNIPVVRVATTGITAVINADGTFGPKIPVNKPGILDLELLTNKIQQPTIYARGGQWMTVLFCLISIFWMMLVNYLVARNKTRGANVSKS